MKKAIFLISVWFLFSSFIPLDWFKDWYDYHYMPFEIAPFAIPGAVGNGIADDTAAIQAWLDSGSTTSPNGNETYRITSRMDIDQNGLQVVDFNGAKIDAGAAIDYIFVPNKADGSETSIRNVEIDGNDMAHEAISWLSWGTGANIEIHNFYRNGGNAIGLRFFVETSKSFGDYFFQNVNIYNIKSEGNGTIGDGFGASRGIILYYKDNQSPTSFTYLGGSLHDVWGDDGDLIQIQDDDQTANSKMMTRFIGTTMYNASRRYGKFTGANIEVIGCDIRTTLANNPEALATTACCAFEYGMVGDSSSNPGYGHKFINNSINLTGANAQLARIQAPKTFDWEINGNTMIGLTIGLYKYFDNWNTTGVVLINNTFTNVQLNGNHLFGDDIIGIGNNTGLINNLNANEWFAIASPPPAPTCSDGIQNQGESGIDVGGLCTGTPTAPTCSDGIQNGDETGIDCGGSCPPCTVAAPSNQSILSARRRSY